MGTISRQTDIERPAEDVWAILTDVRRLPELSASTVAVRGAPARLEQPGQAFTQVVQVLARRFESRWEVTRFGPGRRFTLHGDVGYGARYTLDEAVEELGPHRCRFRLDITYTLPLGVLGKLAGRLGVERLARVEAAQVIEGLKALAERER